MINLNELKQRFAGVPQALQATLEQELVLPPNFSDLLSSSQASLGFDVTGVGASEFPARLLVEALAFAGVRARFRPISTFAAVPVVPPQTSLVVFSQGLSPNARLPLHHSKEYRTVHLFTGQVRAERSECAALFDRCDAVYCHKPESEMGTLLRLVGPACAAYLALRWSALVINGVGGAEPPWVARLAEVPSRYETCSIGLGPLGLDPTGCVAPGELVNLASSLMWKWQEALFTPLAPVFDVLSFAHGPLQSFVGKAAIFLALEREAGGGLLDNLRSTIDKDLHRVHVLKSELPFPLCLFEHDAQLSALALAEMERRGVCPGDWPGMTADGPLYEVGRQED